MKNSGWISFDYKLPYSCIEGRCVAYDFPILVVSDTKCIPYETGPEPRIHSSLFFRMEYNGLYYTIRMAKDITDIYRNTSPEQRIHFLAWFPMEVYNGRS